MPVQPGTVSCDTMRPEDLIPCFMGVLEEHNPAAFKVILAEYPEYQPGEWTAKKAEKFYNSDAASYMLNESIWDAMNSVAPEGYYFGSSEGDGADYGFWKCDEEDDEEDDG